MNEAERLAEWLESSTRTKELGGTHKAVAELRRLAAVERELHALKASLGEPAAVALQFEGDARICLSTVFDTEDEAADYAYGCTGKVSLVKLYALTKDEL